MQDLFARLPFGVILPIFGFAAILVWFAGSRLPHLAAEISKRAGIGDAFGGLLILGGITSLPELATTTSAAAIDASSLALNNILGSVAFNLVLLAIADSILRKSPLTAVIAKSATLMQGVLGMLLLALVAAGIAAGETAILGVGIWSTLLFASCLGAMWVAFHYERRPAWAAVGALPLSEETPKPGGSPIATRSLIWTTLSLAALILTAGTILSFAGNAIAERTGLAGGLIGLLLVAAATSLPELSAIQSAIRLRRYELAIGEVFGSNIFNLSIIFIIDAVSRGAPVLGTSGRFEIIAAMLGLVLTGMFVVGLLERRDRKILGMGYDSLAVLFIYAAGVAFLSRMALEAM